MTMPLHIGHGCPHQIRSQMVSHENPMGHAHGARPWGPWGPEVAHGAALGYIVQAIAQGRAPWSGDELAVQARLTASTDLNWMCIWTTVWTTTCNYGTMVLQSTPTA